MSLSMLCIYLIMIAGFSFHAWDYVTDWYVLRIFWCQCYRFTLDQHIDFFAIFFNCSTDPLQNNVTSSLANLDSLTDYEAYTKFVAVVTDQIALAVWLMFGIFLWSLFSILPSLLLTLAAQYQFNTALSNPMIELGEIDAPNILIL